MWKQPAVWRISGSLLLLLTAFVLSRSGLGAVGTMAYAASITIGGYGLFIKGLRHLFQLRFDMNTLMTMAVFGAAAIGEWGEGAVVVLLFAISEWLESHSMDKARQSIRSLTEMAPNQATLRRKDREITVPVEDIRVGDRMVIRPGQSIAMDGRVVKGASAVNQAAVTGESIPVPKDTDDDVFAGTLNEDGYMEVEVTRTVQDNTLSRIIHRVEEAQSEKAPSQRFVDVFASYYTPLIIALALGIAVVPPLLFPLAWGDWIYRGLTVLVVGCPCALVISTPVAVVTAIGHAARNGVLMKGGIHLEQLGTVQTVAFDKTGTLTTGRPQVTDVLTWQGTRQENVKIAAALESRSQHPLASAVIHQAEREQTNHASVPVESFQSFTGKGVTAQIDGTVYHIGSTSWFRDHPGWNDEHREQVASLRREGKTVLVLGTDRHILSLIAVADPIREGAPTMIQRLKSLGIRSTVMLTGDHRQTADAVGQKLNIDDIRAEQMPEDKQNTVKELKKQKPVAMVGDGVNDAPALASSTVGIAMGGAGSDTALETADVAFMADDIRPLPFTLKLGRRARRIILENVIFSLGIKAIALLLVFPGLLTLWMAIFADMGATLIVTLNGLRLLNSR